MVPKVTIADFVGNELKVGDTVAAVRPNSRSGGHLQRGTIAGFTAKMVRIDVPWQGLSLSHLVKPQSMVKICS